MLNKLIIIGLTSLLLGGCTLSNALDPSGAAKDDQSTPTATPSPSPQADKELEVMPDNSSGTDANSLEIDVNNTSILNEDFSDLN
ncbi:MAG: hypothetical protein WAV40_00165 [Microgenomates group bacterium]